jgi:GNAT superfamily N-acetyltransferase
MNERQITVLEADLSRADHQEATLALIDGYSMDPMGDGKPLSDVARRDLISGLRQHPTTMIFIAYDGAEPIGIAVCFRGFSTFAARTLINIHDFFVVPAYRGKGIGRLLFEVVEERARELGCCKLSLEVQENNHRARSIYAAAGFGRSVYMPEAGGAFFLTKAL